MMRNYAGGKQFLHRLPNGKFIDLVEPDPAAFDIESIAFALAGENRFANGIPFRYTVAEHSVNVSVILGNNRLGLIGLLHDAAEVVIRDIPSPVKKLVDWVSRGALSKLERRILEAIYRGLDFGDISAAEWIEVSKADRLLYRFEVEAFNLGLPVDDFPQSLLRKRSEISISAVFCKRKELAEMFLDRYRVLSAYSDRY